MKTRTTLLILVVAAAALAGCAGNNDTGTPTTTTATTTTGTTPTSTTPATLTTPTITTPSANATGKGVAALVTLDATPARAPAGGNVTVCWSVTGAGNVAHTAVHHDNVSHPSSTSFQDYKGGAIYPNNTTAAVPQGYDLPGRFCAALNVPETGSVYFRAHVIDAAGAPGKLSDEKSIRATGTATTISVVTPPATGAAGTDVTVCWRVEGAGNVPHTALHYDNVSHAGSATFADYKGGAVYPGNATSAAAAGYDLPGTFCGNLPVPAQGTLYYRAHVIDAAGAPGRLTDELSITAA